VLSESDKIISFGEKLMEEVTLRLNPWLRSKIGNGGVEGRENGQWRVMMRSCSSSLWLLCWASVNVAHLHRITVTKELWELQIPRPILWDPESVGLGWNLGTHHFYSSPGATCAWPDVKTPGQSSILKPQRNCSDLAGCNGSHGSSQLFRKQRLRGSRFEVSLGKKLQGTSPCWYTSVIPATRET
jgi:hypothetical protein